MALERIGVGPGLVGAHARAHLAVVSQGTQHGLDVLACIHRAQAGEDLQAVLPETHAVVLEVARPRVALVPAEDPILLRDPHHAFHDLEALDLLAVQGRGVADEIDLGQGLLGADLDVGARPDRGQRREMLHEPLVFLVVLVGVGVQDDDHRT